MNYLSLREIQNIEYDMLKVFAACCDENGFRYYLCGGTLLGAVRHQGFIPWDDDIDVLMPRPDYDLFIKWAEKNTLGTNYEVASMELHNETIPYAKVLDHRYELEKKYRYRGGQDCLWIDIFPMDGINNNRHRVEKIYKQIHRLRKIYAISHAKPFTGRTKFRAISKTVLIPFAKLYGDVHSSQVRERISKQYTWNESEYVAGIVMGYGACEVMKKSEWEPYVEVKFEEGVFHAPGCWDYYLSQLYGDYWNLPPIEKRKTHDMKVYKVET